MHLTILVFACPYICFGIYTAIIRGVFEISQFAMHPIHFHNMHGIYNIKHLYLCRTYPIPLCLLFLITWQQCLVPIIINCNFRCTYYGQCCSLF
jgi:hypothetical protein